MTGKAPAIYLVIYLELFRNLLNSDPYLQVALAVASD